MALDITMDDLIGSMQHGFHAGDRGRELQQIRDNLAFALSPHAMGPSSSNTQSSSSTSINGHAQPFAIIRPSSNSSYGMVGSNASSSSTGYDGAPYGRVGSLGTSGNNSFGSTSSFSRGAAPIPTSSRHAPCPGTSMGSSSGSSSSGGGGGGGGYGFSGGASGGPQAPANTPMQTPVDRVAGSHWPAARTSGNSRDESEQRRAGHGRTGSGVASMGVQEEEETEMEMDGRASAGHGNSSSGGGARTPMNHQSLVLGLQQIHQAQAQMQAGAPPNSPAQLSHYTVDSGMEWPAAISHEGSSRRLAHLL
ncbi:hypothetical protein CF319_g3233 [Tilletia indica]|uniref:Uncharacterized protein n=1 Tax=Tilletia indica TaxID=43049 RepID=A0A177TW91_9BASI|nr:hypothetical protein CF319_g3233 [Tilletia indica]KAE8250603.1 hypothetical protein A4X13_0g4580 [Tilletia indica]